MVFCWVTCNVMPMKQRNDIIRGKTKLLTFDVLFDNNHIWPLFHTSIFIHSPELFKIGYLFSKLQERGL